MDNLNQTSIEHPLLKDKSENSIESDSDFFNFYEKTKIDFDWGI